MDATAYGLTSSRGLTPPFAKDCQPVAGHHAEIASAAYVVDEQERLRRVLLSEELEAMHKQLWYAGRKGNISPLHHQKVLRRDIVLTERPRLHLVWYARTIYIKRLDEELLDWDYFSKVICGCKVTHRAASGFLLSYARLIEYPSDLEIAKFHGLVVTTISWKDWKSFRGNLLRYLDGRDIHDRYEYGELRLDRLNQICRMKFLSLAYFNVHRDYSSYFGENYKTLIALFASVSIALSAMQVVASLDNVPDTTLVTSYRFTIATLIMLSLSCAALLVLYVGLYIWNWLLIFVRRGNSTKDQDW